MKSLTEVRRWATLRCAHCGHRFRWSRDARSSFGNRDGKVYHGPCIAYLIWRAKADERLEVLRIVTNVTGVSGPTVDGLVALSASSQAERIAASNMAFRVFRDLTVHTDGSTT